MKLFSRKQPTLDEVQAALMLEDIFRECDVEPNAVPMEELTSYSNYRKERFGLQRAVLIVGMVLFVLLPNLFVMPSYLLSADGIGERNLPEYRIEVSTLLPIRRVTAVMEDKNLPVYECSAREFTIEPITNGLMVVQVELFNHQMLEQKILVDDVDAEPPQLITSDWDEQYVYLNVEDSGIGVDYRKVYMVDADGQEVRPISYDAETGQVVFELPGSTGDVYVPDHLGNTLHMTVETKQ